MEGVITNIGSSELLCLINSDDESGRALEVSLILKT
jgi:hypothetical protein